MFLLPLQTKLETCVDKRSLSFMEDGSAHLAMPDSMKSFFIHSANHCKPQSQYRGLEPIPLQQQEQQQKKITVINSLFILKFCYYKIMKSNM